MSTPDKYFSGKKIDMAHFNKFGSSFYSHVTKDAQKTLEPITNLGIFVRHTDTPQNYGVYLPSNRMIVICREEEKAMICSLERIFSYMQMLPV